MSTRTRRAAAKRLPVLWIAVVIMMAAFSVSRCDAGSHKKAVATQRGPADDDDTITLPSEWDGISDYSEGFVITDF